ncbi:MAG: hypothetical protein LBI72_11685 [Flavobacteriaceae bacterium]|jgi:hypothetical protein|nr:hypothetical protein [Flavobacteriaceae bacterium]
MKQKYVIILSILTTVIGISSKTYAQEKGEIKTGEGPVAEMRTEVPAEAPAVEMPTGEIKVTESTVEPYQSSSSRSATNDLLFSTSATQDLNKRLKDSKTAHYDSGLLSHLNVAIGVSTMGINIEAATPITKNLKLRAGLDFFSYKSKQYDYDIDDESGSLKDAFGFTPTYEVKAEFKGVHGHALVDFYPFKKGIFHVTAGLYMGNTKLTADGLLTDGNGNVVKLKPGHEWPVIEFDGHILDTNNGVLAAELTLGNAIKPYLGIGLGRTVSKRRIGFNFDLGLLYQGEYTLKQNNKVVATSRDANAQIDGAEDVTKWLKWWPQINFQLHYRIF